MTVIITSHILNGTDGSHAGGVSARLLERTSGKVIFQTQTDGGGRLSQSFEAKDCPFVCELVIETAHYWNERNVNDLSVLGEIVLRFTVSTPEDKVHMPIIISPYSYSTWKSS
ncbi:MAG: hydroxyisourate hydrolase [Pseudomonadota bacterium]